MPVQPTFPGVYVQEVPSGLRTITGVSTSVAAFVGMVNRGPLGLLVRILSFADYERRFGNYIFGERDHDEVRQFFLNGGQQAFIMRIAQGAASAAVTLKNEGEADVLVLTAKDAGTVGDAIRIEIDYDTSSPESIFRILTVYRLVSDGQGGTGAGGGGGPFGIEHESKEPAVRRRGFLNNRTCSTLRRLGGDASNVSALTDLAFRATRWRG